MKKYSYVLDSGDPENAMEMMTDITVIQNKDTLEGLAAFAIVQDEINHTNEDGSKIVIEESRINTSFSNLIHLRNQLDILISDMMVSRITEYCDVLGGWKPPQ